MHEHLVIWVEQRGKYVLKAEAIQKFIKKVDIWHFYARVEGSEQMQK